MDDACGVFQCRPAASSPGFPASVRFPQVVESQAIVLPCWCPHPDSTRSTSSAGSFKGGRDLCWTRTARQRWFWRLQNKYRIKMLSAPMPWPVSSNALGRVRARSSILAVPKDELPSPSPLLTHDFTVTTSFLICKTIAMALASRAKASSGRCRLQSAPFHVPRDQTQEMQLSDHVLVRVCDGCNHGHLDVVQTERAVFICTCGISQQRQIPSTRWLL